MRNEDFMQSSNGVIRIVSLYAGFGLPLDYFLCLRFEGGVFLGIPSRPGIPTWCGGVVGVAAWLRGPFVWGLWDISNNYVQILCM